MRPLTRLPPPPPSFSYSFVNILLPPDAKEIATRFRWWQPRHDGLDQNDWAIDNVLISGSADQRTVMLDTFSSAPVPQHERSPADAGPVGRIAFDVFMEDKTAGTFFIMLNKNPVEMQFGFGSFQKSRLWNLLQIPKWYHPFFLSIFLLYIITKYFLSFKPSSMFLLNNILWFC